MKTIKTHQDWVLFAEESDPLEILESVYGLRDFALMKKRIFQLIESSISRNPKPNFKKDPSYLVYFSKLVSDAIIGLYLLEEKKADFGHLKGKYTNKVIQKIYKKTNCPGNFPWVFYPYSLNKKELNDPIKTLTKIRKAVDLEVWLDFIEQCVHNCLAFGFEPEWEGYNFQTACTYYLTKLYDIGHLIYATETEFGRKYI
ncbi:hypothetical protein A33Q_4691 [Indibacter alkaliphilus LW1]|uniref:Uncharacterized protein n=1 Tax=Indibacter alkaliphilus (strain CCUG 57479 / KCTC 22604 / LW1) TaxID=1189612 RepID=S2CVV7_INDAL|nr:hypothetical protein [Indibacter alkaliphilus]EOZ91302.1 hypothetical protein A33Q_4691 [Indibacter alkaliphilus LW1]